MPVVLAGSNQRTHVSILKPLNNDERLNESSRYMNNIRLRVRLFVNCTILFINSPMTDKWFLCI